jgi:hypothetical protein
MIRTKLKYKCTLKTLLKLIKSGSLFEIDKLIDNHPNILSSKEIIPAAVSTNKISLVKYFIDKGCEIGFEKKILNEVVQGGVIKLEMIKCLVENGFKISPHSNFFLEKAIKFGDLKMIKSLVELGCDPQYIPDVTSYWLDRYHRFEMIKYFVDKGSKLSHVGMHTLRWIIYKRHWDVLIFLVKKTNCLSDHDMIYALSVSFQCGFLDTFEYLISKGVEVTKCNKLIYNQCARAKSEYWPVKHCCSVELLNHAHCTETIGSVSMLLKVNVDVNDYKFLYHLSAQSRVEPFVYSFSISTLKNKMEYLHTMRDNFVGSSRDKYTENKNAAAIIFQKQIKIQAICRKYQLLKFILKPLSLHMQLTSIE